MLRSFDGLAVRQIKARRLRAFLTTFGIVLGVGMVFGVLLLAGTIRHTFDDLIDSAWGSKDLIVQPASGGGVLPQDTIARVRDTPGVREASGMVGAVLTRLDERGRAITGMRGRMFVAGFASGEPAPYDFDYVSGRPARAGREIVVERNWARDRGVEVGQTLGVATSEGPTRLRVVGVFRFSSGLSFGQQGLAGMPLEEARRIVNVPAGWHQISLAAEDRGRVEELRDRLKAALGRGIDVRTPTDFSEELGAQLRALDILLLFFSGIAMFVGGFLIFNAFSMTVVQRMRELGMLRTLGASRRMIRRSVLLEALALAGVGVVAGLGFGLALAKGLIALTSSLGIPIGNLHVAPSAAAIAAAVGVVVTLAGAWYPARRASAVSPLQAMAGTAQARRRPVTRRALVGVALFLPGALLGGELWFGGGAETTLGGIAAITLMMLMFAGMAMAAPIFITPLVRGLAVPLRRISPACGRLASDATRGNPGRTAGTAVALTIGLSVFVVNSAISASFITSIHDQVDASFARDVTVRATGAGILDAAAQPMSPTVRRRILELPQAGVVTPVRATTAKLPGLRSGAIGVVMGIDPVPYAQVDHSDIDGATRAAALAGVSAGGAIISRSYATSAHLDVGDDLVLRGPGVTETLRVSGILRTATEFEGHVIQVSLAVARDVYGLTNDAQLLVRARTTGERGALLAGVQRILRDHPQLEALSSADVKQKIDDEISQQFNLFNTMVAIAVIVSLLGVVNTLVMSMAERTRDIGVLRALGSSRWLVRLTVMDESLLITLAGAIAGLAIGLPLAWWWTGSFDDMLPGIAFHVPVGAAVGVTIAAVVLGVLAAAWPARRAARMKVIQALSYE